MSSEEYLPYDLKELDLDSKEINDEEKLFLQIKDYLQIEALILSNNYLERLIPDLSLFEKLKYLNIENNPFEDISELIQSLQTLPALESLKVSVSSQEEAEIFSNSLPNLKYLNDNPTAISRIDQDPHKEDDNREDQEDRTYENENENEQQSIRNLDLEIDIEENSISDPPLSIEAERYNQIFTKLNEKVKKQGSEAVSTFYESYQRMLSEQSDKVAASEKQSPRYLLLSDQLDAKYNIISLLVEKNLELLERKDKELTLILRTLINSLSDVHTTNQEMLHLLDPIIKQKNKLIQAKLEEANRVTNPDKENQKLMEDLRATQLELETYKDELKSVKSSLGTLEKENIVLTEKIIKLTKDLTDTNQNKGQAVVFHSPENKFKAYYNSAKVLSPSKNVRILTKKNMHDLINDIYTSKTLFDKKCIDLKMPRETMEQHMYTYLNQKFGLKNLIIEWATSIINGIKMYSPEDPDICLFGKILKNELEEEYRTVFKKLKTSIADLLIVRPLT